MTSQGGGASSGNCQFPQPTAGPRPGLGGRRSPLEDVNTGGREHDLALAGEGAGADVTVRLAAAMRAQAFWGSGQAGPSFPPWPSLCATGRVPGVTGAESLEAWGPSLLGMWRAVAGELKYLVAPGCPLQEGVTNVLGSVACLSTLSPG